MLEALNVEMFCTFDRVLVMFVEERAANQFLIEGLRDVCLVVALFDLSLAKFYKHIFIKSFFQFVIF